MRLRYITVSAEVDISDVIDELDDDDLAERGLMRVSDQPVPSDQIRSAIYAAAESGDFAAMLRAVESMAWEVDGRILVTRLAA